MCYNVISRNQLSYEQFGAFLANIKELNAHKQSREVINLSFFAIKLLARWLYRSFGIIENSEFMLRLMMVIMIIFFFTGNFEKNRRDIWY